MLGNRQQVPTLGKIGTGDLGASGPYPRTWYREIQRDRSAILVRSDRPVSFPKTIARESCGLLSDSHRAKKEGCHCSVLAAQNSYDLLPTGSGEIAGSSLQTAGPEWFPLPHEAVVKAFRAG